MQMVSIFFDYVEKNIIQIRKKKNAARLNLKMLNQNDLDLDFYSYHAIKV